MRRFGIYMGVLAGGLVVLSATLLGLAWENFGAKSETLPIATLEKNGRWAEGKFLNTEPMFLDLWGSTLSMFETSPFATPSQGEITPEYQGEIFPPNAPPGLHVLWLGHSTCLIEIDGHRFLTDPVFDERASPWTFMGPAPWYPSILTAEELPSLDAVVISHDHYDHLSRHAIQALQEKTPLFIVPLGVGAHLRQWGVTPEKIQELDWWEDVDVGKVTVTATPGRHASGRSLTDQNRTLWMGAAFKGPSHRVYFSGDTGWTEAFKIIGERLGPFHVTLVDSGAYHASWPDWHLGPEWAVVAHQAVKGNVLIPIHWGRFTLAPHGWTEPGERSRVAAALLGQRIALLAPGEPYSFDEKTRVRPWWPNLPWSGHGESPIPATLGGLGTPRVPVPPKLSQTK